MNIQEMARRIDACTNFGELYTLSEELAKIGLAVCECHSHRVVLCRVEDGHPIKERLSDDFIFIGSTRHECESIPESLRKCVIEFIERNASAEQEVKRDAYKWNGFYKLYASPVTITNDDVASTMQDMCLQTMLTSGTEQSLLDAISEWLEGNNAQL